MAHYDGLLFNLKVQVMLSIGLSSIVRQVDRNALKLEDISMSLQASQRFTVASDDMNLFGKATYFRAA